MEHSWSQQNPFTLQVPTTERPTLGHLKLLKINEINHIKLLKINQIYLFT